MRTVVEIKLVDMFVRSNANAFPSLYMSEIGSDQQMSIYVDAGHPAMLDYGQRLAQLRQCKVIREWLDRLEEELRRSVDTQEPSR